MLPYPFAAVVGHDDLALALLLNSVEPAIGGVLVRGEKGTAKSTMVRALGRVLPDEPVVRGCRFRCDPVRPDPGCPDGPHEPDGPADNLPASLVELPVGAGEDRVVGSLDIERILVEGVKAFEPGLLARAHRGLLYVDEVNLLHDHLVDTLLDAAAMGRVHVERDGVSVSHQARFVLVGTMNPEEGELRPQLLDRFGLSVEVAASRDPQIRAEVVRRRLAYAAAGGAGAGGAGAAAAGARGARGARAPPALPSVQLSDAVLSMIASVCATFEVDGMRADLVIARAACAHAAWEGRSSVTAEDVRAAARLALPHRRRRDPFDSPGLDEEQLDSALDEAAGAPLDDTHGDAHDDASHDDGPPDEDPPGGSPPGGGGPPPDSPPDGTSGAGEPEQPGSPEEPADEVSDEGPDEPTGGPGGDPSPRTGGGPSGQGRPAGSGNPYRTRLLTVSGRGQGAAGRRSAARTAPRRLPAHRRAGHAHRGRATPASARATRAGAVSAGARPPPPRARGTRVQPGGVLRRRVRVDGGAGADA